MYVLKLIALFAITFCCFGKNTKADLLPADASEKVESYLRHGPLEENLEENASKKTRSAAHLITQTNWIEQKLDHFDSSNTKTWKMRYISNMLYFKPQKPILIYVGAEWEISPRSIVSGHYVDIAIELNAALYYTEHRFYGESKPTEDMSTDNLKYIHTKQALADLAHFIRTLKTNPDMKDSQVVLASGSYGGVMVAWFRKLYPELAVGAWSSCAPLQAKVEFKEYNEVAGRSIRLVCGTLTYERIKNGIKKIEQTFDKDPESVLKKLNICSDFDKSNQMDVWQLFSVISNLFKNIIQSGTYGSISQKICDPIAKFNGSDEDAVANFFVEKLNQKGCNGINYKKYRLARYSVSKWEYWANTFNQRAWFYQTCTQFGYFQISSPIQPLGNRYPIKYYLQHCQDLFNISADEVYKNINSTNEEFGALNIGVSNVFYTNGYLDPWSALAIKQNNGKSNVVEWASHFADFTSINPQKDNKQMIELKNDIRNAIKSWINVKA